MQKCLQRTKEIVIEWQSFRERSMWMFLLLIHDEKTICNYRVSIWKQIVFTKIIFWAAFFILRYNDKL